MSYKLNIPFKLDITKTIKDGEDTVLSIVKIIILVVTLVILALILMTSFIRFELPDKSQEYRAIFLIFILFMYSISHKKEQND